MERSIASSSSSSSSSSSLEKSKYPPLPMNLTPELYKQLFDLFPSNDPLDDPNFNAVNYINQRFPNEQSLSEIDGAINQIKGKIKQTDSEILKEVYRQARLGDNGKKDLQDAKDSISELFTKINDIKKKAEQSEQMVCCCFCFYIITRFVKQRELKKKLKLSSFSLE